MSKNWVALVKEQGELAQQIAERVVQALSLPDLSSDQLNRLYRLVVQGSQDYEAFLEEMSEYDVPDGLEDAADAIDNIWSNLVIGVANESRKRQGLEPIEILA